MTHGEAMHEVGRLTAESRTKEREIRDLRENNDKISHEAEYLHQELLKMKTEMQTIEAERSDLHKELIAMKKIVKERDASIKRLNDDMFKAQKTIKVQSDQIATPLGLKKPPMTPHHQGPSPEKSNPTFIDAPPAYQKQRAHQSFTYTNGSPTGPPPMSRQCSAQIQSRESYLSVPIDRQQSGQVENEDPFEPPPMSRQSSAQASAQESFYSSSLCRYQNNTTPIPPSFRAAPEASQSNSFNRGMTQPPNPLYNNFGSHQVAVVAGGDLTGISLLGEHTSLFKEVEHWARNYTNVPSKEHDQAMPPLLFATLTGLTNPEIVRHLICTSSTRYFAVAKIINSTLANVPLRPVLIRGFTHDFDARIADLRSQLSRTGLPLQMRRALLVASTEIVEEMMHASGFKNWIQEETLQHVRTMWTLLEPLFAPGVPRNEAWDDLVHIWGEAVRIGLLQVKKVSSFSLDFPPVGPNSRFNPSNMNSRDPAYKEGSQTLGQMGAYVRLSVTPIVSETDFTRDAVVPKILHYANVLVAT